MYKWPVIIGSIGLLSLIINIIIFFSDYNYYLHGRSKRYLVVNIITISSALMLIIINIVIVMMIMNQIN